MKRLLLILTFLGLSAAGALAVNIEWRGGVCLTAVNPACSAIGWSVGDCGSLRFSPPNVGTNGSSTKFATFWGNNFAEAYTKATGSLIGTTFRTVNGVGVGRSGFTFTSTMRFTSQIPGAPTATSDAITIVGDIKNFDGTVGCNMSFRAAVTRQP